MEHNESQVPDWARRISKLRQRLGLSQAALGAKLRYSPIAVSRWERGAKEPPAHCWIQLGNIAGGPDCWWFWSRAGLKASDVLQVLPRARGALKARQPKLQIVVAGGGKKAGKVANNAKLVAIPVLPIHAATRGEKGDHHMDFSLISADLMVAAPQIWCPHPDDTTCLRVKGSSMSPSVNDGDIIAVDTSETDSSKLNGKIVVSWHREHGLSLARFRRVDGMETLESENREYEPIVFGKDRKWRIIGKVVWWLRKAP
jgi:DNA-binding XRE family transcriptional regulator